MGLGEVRACHVVFLGLVVIGGIYWYRKQAPERRERIKEATFDIGSRLMDQFEMAIAEVQLERVQVHACVVPIPGRRTPVSAILRELAMSDESLQAQQIADLADSQHPENDASRGNPPVRLRRSSVADRGARSFRYERNRYRALAAHDGTFASGK